MHYIAPQNDIFNTYLLLYIWQLYRKHTMLVCGHEHIIYIYTLYMCALLQLALCGGGCGGGGNNCITYSMFLYNYYVILYVCVCIYIYLYVLCMYICACICLYVYIYKIIHVFEMWNWKQNWHCIMMIARLCMNTGFSINYKDTVCWNISIP